MVVFLRSQPSSRPFGNTLTRIMARKGIRTLSTALTGSPMNGFHSYNLRKKKRYLVLIIAGLESQGHQGIEY
jgi:hypothetical protein